MPILRVEQCGFTLTFLTKSLPGQRSPARSPEAKPSRRMSSLPPPSNLTRMLILELVPRKKKEILAASVAGPLATATRSDQPYLRNYNDAPVQLLELSQK